MGVVVGGPVGALTGWIAPRAMAVFSPDEKQSSVAGSTVTAGSISCYRGLNQLYHGLKQLRSDEEQNATMKTQKCRYRRNNRAGVIKL